MGEQGAARTHELLRQGAICLRLPGLTSAKQSILLHGFAKIHAPYENDFHLI